MLNQWNNQLDKEALDWSMRSITYWDMNGTVNQMNNQWDNEAIEKSMRTHDNREINGTVNQLNKEEMERSMI